jgi:hypothetical protein
MIKSHGPRPACDQDGKRLKVVVQLALQSALDHHLGQLPQQTALTGQLQPPARARSVSSRSTCSSAADSPAPSLP